MRRRRVPVELLRWYPRAWRERYGEEFLALLEDRVAEHGLTPLARLAIVWAGLRERARFAALVGDRCSVSDGAQAGLLLVLCSWAVFVVAGASFAKYSEQFAATVPAASRSVPWGAFRAVQILAVVATVAVAVGAALVVPAFRRFLHAGGWRLVRRSVQRAAVATVVAVAAAPGLVAWANSLTFEQRNGGDRFYGVAVVAWALVLVASLALWTAAAVAVGRRLTLSRSVIATETALAGVLTAVMIAMTVATGIWWTAMATDAPWFLHGTPPGTPGSAFEPRLAITMATMGIAVIAGMYGTTRAGRSWYRLRAG